jgi:hypothetical protein
MKVKGGTGIVLYINVLYANRWRIGSENIMFFQQAMSTYGLDVIRW